MNIRIENWKLLTLSAFYIVFAFVSYQIPAKEFLSFFKVAGILIAMGGGIQILIYFLKKDYLHAQDFNFSMGILFIFAGILVSTKADVIVKNYRAVIASVVVLDSILRLQYSMNLFRIKDALWKTHVVLAILPLLLGMMQVFYALDDLASVYFSILLIFDAGANIFTVLYYKKRVKELTKPEKQEMEKQ